MKTRGEETVTRCVRSSLLAIWSIVAWGEGEGEGDLNKVSDRCQIGVRSVSDRCQIGVRSVSDRFQIGAR